MKWYDGFLGISEFIINIGFLFYSDDLNKYINKLLV